jgi:hypothetical protein
MTTDTEKGGEVFVTTSTRLATALLSLGQTLQRPPCTRQVRRDGSTVVTFLFEPGNCGKLALQWFKIEEQDPGTDTPADLQNRITWLRELEEEPDPVKTAYINAAWRDIALMIVKATPRMVAIHGAGMMGFVREDASKEEIRQIQRQL